MFTKKNFSPPDGGFRVDKRAPGRFSGVAAIPKPPSEREADGITARHYSAPDALH
jgi:hypothetical protein